MAQPNAYEPQTNFSELAQPADIGRKLDAELHHLGDIIGKILTNLSLIQADDGGLQHGIVDGDALNSGTAVGVKPAEKWEKDTKYRINQTVFVGFALYRCKKAHKAEVFTDDLEAGNWEAIVSFDNVNDLLKDAGFRRIADNFSAISALAVNIDRINVIVDNMETVQSIVSNMPRLEKLVSMVDALSRIDLNTAAITKVAQISDAVELVVQNMDKIEASIEIAQAFALVKENLPAIQKIAAQIEPIVDVATNLDAVLDAPTHAARAEQAAASMGRRQKYKQEDQPGE